jgi:hypothetical protein
MMIVVLIVIMIVVVLTVIDVDILVVETRSGVVAVLVGNVFVTIRWVTMMLLMLDVIN